MHIFVCDGAQWHVIEQKTKIATVRTICSGVATVGHWPHHQPLWTHHQQSRDPIPVLCIDTLNCN